MTLLKLQEAEQPRVGGDEPRDLVVHFLKSARGVHPVAKTVHNDWVPGSTFDDRCDQWEQGLATDAECELWHYMQDQRDWDEHGDGAALVSVAIPIPLDFEPNVTVFAQGTAGRPTMAKGGVEFAKYPNRKASEVCSEYLALCRKFVDDFLHDPDHAALI